MLLLLDMLADDAHEFIIQLDIALCQQNLERGVDQVEVNDGIPQAFFGGHELIFYAGEGEGRIAPALFEDAVDLVEKEEQAVLFVEAQFHFTGPEGLNGNDICVGQLEDEHAAVGVYLEHAAVLLSLDGQREGFADLKIRIITHNRKLLCGLQISDSYSVSYLDWSMLY